MLQMYEGYGTSRIPPMAKEDRGERGPRCTNSTRRLDSAGFGEEGIVIQCETGSHRTYANQENQKQPAAHFEPSQVGTNKGAS
jgi:hypothetical protein